jgi:hypothetical protein
MKYLLLTSLVAIAALLAVSIVLPKKNTWIFIVALVLVVVAGVMSVLVMRAPPPPQVGVMCDVWAAGQVRNQELLCQPLGDDKYRCYLPNAGCERVSVDVEAVDESAIDWQSALSSEDMYVKTKDKTFNVSAEMPRAPGDSLGAYNYDTFIGSRDLPNAQKAYELLPYPVIRAVVGSVLGGG